MQLMNELHVQMLMVIKQALELREAPRVEISNLSESMIRRGNLSEGRARRASPLTMVKEDDT